MSGPAPKTGLECAVEASGLVLRSYASWWKDDVDDAMPMFEELAAATEAAQHHDRAEVRRHLRNMRAKLTGLRRFVLEADRERFQLLLGAMVLPDGADLEPVIKREPSP